MTIDVTIPKRVSLDNKKYKRQGQISIYENSFIPENPDNVQSDSFCYGYDGGDYCIINSNNGSIVSEAKAFNIKNPLNQGQIQFQLRFSDSPLLNIDDKRLKGLAGEKFLQKIKRKTELNPFCLSEAVNSLLVKVEKCVASSNKIRKAHGLNLIGGPLNPLLNKQLERTTAVNTTIIILNSLFLDINDAIGFK
ncbi:hypothetical protein AB4K20DRAFT_1862986 [Rhizopus microsporus]